AIRSLLQCNKDGYNLGESRVGSRTERDVVCTLRIDRHSSGRGRNMAEKKTGNPFFNVDFSKVLSDVQVPGVDIDAILASQRKNIEAVTAANQLAIEGMQAVLRRQAEILRQSLEK